MPSPSKLKKHTNQRLSCLMFSYITALSYLRSTDPYKITVFLLNCCFLIEDFLRPGYGFYHFIYFYLHCILCTVYAMCGNDWFWNFHSSSVPVHYIQYIFCPGSQESAFFFFIKTCFFFFWGVNIQCHQRLWSAHSAFHRVCWLLHRENIFLCCTHCVVTVIGKDLDSLSSWWTFNEALFMLQPQRERAEKCQTGPSRRAVWGWKHFEVRERLRGLITRLCCHSCQLPYQSKQKSTAEPGFAFPTPPKH